MLIARLRSVRIVSRSAQCLELWTLSVDGSGGVVVMGARGFCGKRSAWRWQMEEEIEAMIQ